MMNPRFYAVALLALGVICSALVSPVQAQVQMQVQAQKSQLADFVVALVNSEPITNSEVRAATLRVSAQFRAQGQPVPPLAELQKNVLERLINDRAQLQQAAESGIRIDDATLDQAEQNLARQNQMDVASWRQRMTEDGLSLSSLRAQLRDQIMIARLREREVDARIRISDADVERTLAEQQATNNDPMTQEINLAQLLVAVPERADTQQVEQLQAQAQNLLKRIRAGERFETLVKQYSDAERAKDGQLGLRRADRYPLVFVQATQKLPVGGVSELVHSGAGFHILKVVERRAAAQRALVQQRVRHILLRTTPELSAFAASTRLAEVRQRIVSGKTSFASAARELSQDGSAAQGGDLGWSSPGSFVPEFEEAMRQLKDGDISAPVVSRFGVHLIQVTDQRRVELSAKDVREQLRQQLRETKLEEAWLAWARDVRQRAYVEMREPPQ
ncbi:MAG: peptidylprolyl isomerase [Rhodoferax sp.]|nr:peptidylprolyl isomerase [Rhodoferax sp.]